MIVNPPPLPGVLLLPISVFCSSTCEPSPTSKNSPPPSGATPLLNAAPAWLAVIWLRQGRLLQESPVIVSDDWPRTTIAIAPPDPFDLPLPSVRSWSRTWAWPCRGLPTSSPPLLADQPPLSSSCWMARVCADAATVSSGPSPTDAPLVAPLKICRVVVWLKFGGGALVPPVLSQDAGGKVWPVYCQLPWIVRAVWVITVVGPRLESGSSGTSRSPLCAAWMIWAN